MCYGIVSVILMVPSRSGILSHFDKLKSLRGMQTFSQIFMVFTPSSDPVFGVINVNCLILIRTLGKRTWVSGEFSPDAPEFLGDDCSPNS